MAILAIDCALYLVDTTERSLNRVVHAHKSIVTVVSHPRCCAIGIVTDKTDGEPKLQHGCDNCQRLMDERHAEIRL